MRFLAIICFLFLVQLSFVKAQRSRSIQFEEGFIFLDLLGRENDPLEFYKGYASKTDLSYSYSIGTNKLNRLNYGIGMSFLKILDSNEHIEDSWYAKLHHGMDFNINRDWLELFYQLNYLYRLNKVEDVHFHKRYYLTLDLGLLFQVSDQLTIYLGTPLSLSPLLSGPGGYTKANGVWAKTEFWVETIGISIGARW